ncbi:hypothetical protein [Actinobaculum sp. 352]|uniref:hypothetical protein n=1 Tax=Actinobaculum sp. 352 TaxID=2490946 RepID=UPI000F7DE583|nr:hypothetical protein [Actinobaculum sp. 352]RTE50613.1 hypothetical protein EKN07_00165 [Actinobaculum sp. 352]
MNTAIRVCLVVAAVGIISFSVVLAILRTNSSGTDPKILAEGSTLRSPSGEFSAKFSSEQVDGKRYVYPVIVNTDGDIVWQDSERYLMSAHPVAVIWQEDNDTLWLLSSDIGTSRVVKETSGQWAKDWDWDTLPIDIQKVRGR